MHSCTSALDEKLHSFRSCFTRPGFRHFTHLVTAWLLLRGSHTLSRVFQVARRTGSESHHSSTYRFFSHGRWSLDSIGHVLFGLLRPHLSETVLAIVDDTLCVKTGRQMFGVGVHHDASRSSYGPRASRKVALSFGHSWVVLALRVFCPWNSERTWAVPVLFRLYRQSSRCSKKEYKKRSHLASIMIKQVARWLDDDEQLLIVGDAAYCCKTVLRGLPKDAHFVGPLPMNAALHECARPVSSRGRPRRKGLRIANPKTRLQKDRRWDQIEITMYGRLVRVQFFSCVCVWYHPMGNRPVRIVITRDRKIASDGRAYVCTNPDLSPEEILMTYARRWQLEVAFRDIKQELGFDHPRNGWWRRLAGKRDDPVRRAKRANCRAGKKAVERTAPLAALAYAFALLWYFDHGNVPNDVARARGHAPWYRHKQDVSFADMLAAFRRATWLDELRRMQPNKSIRQNSEDLWLLAGNAA